MTKPIVSVAAMMLVEEGKLDLLAPVSKYLPEFKDLKVGVERLDPPPARRRLSLEPQARPMTVQDLLRHTSGLVYGREQRRSGLQGLSRRQVSRSRQTLAEIDASWRSCRSPTSPAGCGNTACPPMCSAGLSKSCRARISTPSSTSASPSRSA